MESARLQSQSGSTAEVEGPGRAGPPLRIRFLTFNTWGLKWVSKHRRVRMRALADMLAGGDPAEMALESVATSGDDGLPPTTGQYDVIALQEVWCREDWEYIVERCHSKYPYHRIFYAGILTGPGLALLSCWPIDSSFLYRFPINGRPSAFFRGDWYVGKSVAVTTVTLPGSPGGKLAIMNSHMHAPYALTGDAAYTCHRACQAWDFSRLAQLYSEAGYAVIIVGDLNSRPESLQHQFLTQETGLADSWEQLGAKAYPPRPTLAQVAKMSALDQLKYGCTTCDSLLNTWRSDRRPDEACRLDYALVDPHKLLTVDAGVQFTERIPGIGSFSDHFAYYCELHYRDNSKDEQTPARDLLLKRYSSYVEMCDLIDDYLITAHRQKFWRGIHFWASLVLIIGCCVSTSFTSYTRAPLVPRFFWVLFASVLAVTGLIDGLISFLFGRSELRALREVKLEVTDAQRTLQCTLDTA
ncbi:inositol phosphosphingolipid phospholipase KNAG_0C00710 [Huiozyma naganishii CBS 8797]|uniref:Endonuclease/exonuclease/phosphatase domain-containing protein n=1 Tax=Huiozyma naganishii (strain ATCC MYA-139 / BCRC 22969 / CBS 8797 / KCTC 17520 / NBRC 10181 / NCYC 3082 / Yp74L-3) TaxID=1071383 RepID=J7S4A5_HUIN7|nr:hypothetical protein KNAG_0C00710 [Kazachstania naganishii CBS 8797]CCK69184.1 hypothetical protein KNAG_0C00710 [Kazachstania naganishii CBS 8797]